MLEKEPWRIAVGFLSIIFIAFMWVKNDVISIYKNMPKEQVLPLVTTTVAVTLLKVIAIAGTILLIKWIIVKIRNSKK